MPSLPLSLSKLSLSSKPPSNPTVPYTPLPSPIATTLLQTWDSHDFGTSAPAFASWMNARWKKSGYEVEAEVVCFHLRLEGRDARMEGRWDGEYSVARR